MRRIALVTSSFLPRVGGVEEHVLHVARALARRGHDVAVWTVDQGDKGVPRDVDGIPVRSLPCPLPARSASAAAQFLASSPAALARWVRAAREDRPEVLHVHCFGPNGVWATEFARASGRSLVVSSHGETFMDATGAYADSALLRTSLRRALRRADAVTACSAFTAAHLSAHYGLAPGGARVVPNGIDDAEPGGPAPSWLPARYVLGVGRLVATKGFDLLIRAFARVDAEDGAAAGAAAGVDLVIGGDGPERAALRDLADGLGIGARVHLPGRLTRPEVVTVMAGAQALVVPSRVEAFGITVLEGWRAGVPVIATSVGGPPEFLTDGATGLLVDPSDGPALADAIRRVLADPDLGRRLGAAGRDAVGAFTWEAVAESYEEVYRALPARGRGGAGRRPATSGTGSAR